MYTVHANRDMGRTIRTFCASCSRISASVRTNLLRKKTRPSLMANMDTCKHHTAGARHTYESCSCLRLVALPL